MLHQTRTKWEELCKMSFVCFTCLFQLIAKKETFFNRLGIVISLKQCTIGLHSLIHYMSLYPGWHLLLFYGNRNYGKSISILYLHHFRDVHKTSPFFRPALQEKLATRRLTPRTKSQVNGWVKQMKLSLDQGCSHQFVSSLVDGSI